MIIIFLQITNMITVKTQHLEFDRSEYDITHRFGLHVNLQR